MKKVKLEWDENDFLTQLDNGQRVINFEAFANTEFPMILLITERGEKGKTFGAKEFMLEQHINNNKKSIWLRSTMDQCEKEKGTFLMDNKLKSKLENWENVILERDYLIHDKRPFCEIVPLSKAENYKGGRHNPDYIIYDEFNTGLTNIKNKQAYLLLNLISTYDDSIGSDKQSKLKVFLFGNNKSYDTPLLIDLKVFKIDNVFTGMFSPNGTPILLIYEPKPDMAKIEERKAGNWIYEIAKVTGESDNIYGNMSRYDRLNGILEPIGINLYPICQYKVDDRWYMYNKFLDEGFKYYLITMLEHENTDIKTIVLNQKEMESGFIYSTKVKSALILQMKKKKLYFDTIATKGAITGTF